MAEQAAPTGRTLDVAEFLGGLKITPLHVVAWSFIPCLGDLLRRARLRAGSPATLPYIRDEMGLTPSTMMGLVSSAAVSSAR